MAELGPYPASNVVKVGSLQVGGGGHWGMPISIALKSNNIEQLRLAKEALQDELNKVSKLKDVVNNDPPGLREIKIILRKKLLRMTAVRSGR